MVVVSLPNQLKETLISSVCMLANNGLQFGKLGCVMALLCESEKNRYTELLIDHLTYLIADKDNDVSYAHGVIGKMLGVLFLYSNHCIDIEFDEIFKEDFIGISNFSQSVLSSNIEKVDCSHLCYLAEYYILSEYLAHNNSELKFYRFIGDFESFFKIKADSIRKSREEFSFSDLLALSRRLMQIAFVSNKPMYKDIALLYIELAINYSVRKGQIINDADFLYEVFIFSNSLGNANLTVNIEGILNAFIYNYKIQFHSFKDFIAGYNLYNKLHLLEKYQNIVSPQLIRMKGFIENIHSNLYNSVASNILLNLKGGIPRLLLYHNQNVQFKELMLL